MRRASRKTPARPTPAVSPTPSAPADPEAITAARIWDRVAAEHPDLTQAIAFQRGAWPLLRRAAPGASPPAVAAADVREGFLAGIPLAVSAAPHFADEPPWTLLRELAELASLTFERKEAAITAEAARRRQDAVGAGLAAALRRDGRAVAAAAAEVGADGEVFANLCDLAVSPSLRALADVAAAFLDSGLWARGYCPLCGAWPIFGELRDAGKSRHLRCGLCGADWAFARLACPHCGETDHRRLSALHVEGEAEHRRAELCDSCKGYVKSLARLAPTSVALLAVEDLATAYLDLLALDAGYRRPAAPPVFGTAAPADA